MHEFLIKRATELFPRAEIRLNGVVVQAAPVAPKRQKAEPEDLEALRTRYNELGGDSWMFADVMMPKDREAEQIFWRMRKCQ